MKRIREEINHLINRHIHFSRRKANSPPKSDPLLATHQHRSDSTWQRMSGLGTGKTYEVSGDNTEWEDILIKKGITTQESVLIGKGINPEEVFLLSF
jgi:hypothetical protein